MNTLINLLTSQPTTRVYSLESFRVNQLFSQPVKKRRNQKTQNSFSQENQLNKTMVGKSLFTVKYTPLITQFLFCINH